MSMAEEKILTEHVDDIEEENFNEETQVVGFAIDGEEYALSIMQVREIIIPPKITKIPRAPEFIEGVIDLRESVLPVMDLRKRLGLDAAEHTEDTRILVVNIGDTEIGLIVDSVTEVIRLENKLIEEAPSIVKGIEAEFIDGICRLERGLVVLLNMEKILSADELKGLDSINKDL